MTTTAVVNLTLLLLVLGYALLWLPVRAVRKRRGQRRAAVETAYLQEQVIALGRHLREHLGVDCTEILLTPFARAGWTTADLDAAHVAAGKRPHLLPLLLRAATDASDRPGEPEVPLTARGVALWGGIGCRDLDTSDSKSMHEVAFRSALSPMRAYAVVGDHEYSAWAYAAGMAVDEAVAHRRTGSASLVDLQMLAGLRNFALDVPDSSGQPASGGA